MKAKLRALAKSRIDELDEKVYLKMSENLSNLLIQYLNELKSNSLFTGHLDFAAFIPIQKEPLWFLNWDERFGKKVLIPVLKNETQMDFYPLEVSKIKDKCIKMNVEENFFKNLNPIIPKVALIPGLGFSHSLDRLGRGKGYYDRYLEDHNILKIGTCFECQIDDAITSFDLDVKMNVLITEKNIYRG